MNRGRSSSWDQLCQALAIGLPWLMGVLHGSPQAHFADDIQLLRSFGQLPIGLEGLISAALTALFGLLPLGSKLLRASLVGAASLALGSWLAYRLARQLLERTGTRDGLRAPLALMAALGVALAPSWALEGSAAGGHALAAALALACLSLPRNEASEPRHSLFTFALLAATLLESRATGATLAVALLARWLLGGRGVPSRSGYAAAAVALAAGLSLPIALAVSVWCSPSPNAGLAWGFLRHGWSLSTIPVERSVALAAWLSEMGLIGLLLALLGAVLGVRDRAVRIVVVPALIFLAADLSFDGGAHDPTRHDGMSGTRLVALCALSAVSVFALARSVAWLNSQRIAFARAVSVLLVVYGFSLVLVSADDAEVLLQRREASAAESFTDEACASLPPHSAVLLRSEAVTFRLLAAQVVQGSRPDLLVVALPLLEHGGLRTELLARERGFVPLVREMLLSGKPNENALSALADARPTYIEFDPAWDPRLRTHLVPQAFFTRFAAQPVGPSDRREQIERGEHALARVITRLQGSARHDLATRVVMANTLGQRAVLLTALGDRETAEPLVSELLALEPRSRVALELQARLRRSPKDRLDVNDLFPML